MPQRERGAYYKTALVPRSHDTLRKSDPLALQQELFGGPSKHNPGTLRL